MNAAELACLIDNWTDAFLIAEIVNTPAMCVGKNWDLHDWHVIDVPDGFRFQRNDANGVALQAVEVLNAGDHEPLHDASHLDWLDLHPQCVIVDNPRTTSPC